MTYTSVFEQVLATKTAYLGGSDWQITAQFNTGFSGFGFGYIPPSTLPVQLISFSGMEKNRMSELQWKVEGENMLSHYAIQRSKDGTGYEDIGSVNAINRSEALQYFFTDRTPYNGINYYRLAMHDLDGSKKFSGIIPININLATSYKVLPNPFHEKLQIAVENPSGK
jgi:hypothetical protein